MSWSQQDLSFKKLSNKRVTTSTGKGLPEEKGASALELYLPDIKTELIPGTGNTATGLNGVLYYYGPSASFGQTLVVDTSVPGNLTWFASSGYGNTTTANDGSAGSESLRLFNWVSDKYDAFGTVSGAGYEIKLFDSAGNLITKSDASNWLFDYQTGILLFNGATLSNGNPVSTSGPYRIVGWRYVGQKGTIPAYFGGLGYTSYTKGDLLVGAGSTFIKLNVGSNDYVLTADSTTSSGLKWAVGSGITTLNSLTATSQSFEVGTAGNVFNISSIGSSHTFNIPIAGSGSTGLITTLAQTIAGQKTFTSAIIGDLTGTATTAGFATTANYSNQSGYAITSGLATTATYAHQSGYAITSGLATTSEYSYQSGYAITSGIATTATYAYQSGYGITSGFATTSANLNISNASTGTLYPVLSNIFSSASGVGASVSGLFSFNASNGAFGATSVNIFVGQSYSIGGNSVLSATSLGTGVTNSSLTALGTITTGTWAGSTITTYYGGTGLTSITTGNAFLSSNSAGTALTYRTFLAGSGTTITFSDNSVTFAASELVGGSGTSAFVPIWTASGTALTDSIINQYESVIIVSGSIKAITKSFKIDHPLDPENKYLEHGSLEGPEHGIYQRGRASGYKEVKVLMPDYFMALGEDSYSIQITPRVNANLYISESNGKGFKVKRIGGFIFSNQYIEFDYFVVAERKDVKIELIQSKS